jgi:coatomer protein complex subunit epsilon
MGRIEEAETALDQALALEPENSIAIANKFVLDTIAGKDASEARAKLQSVDKESEILADLAAKREAFQAAMAKYNPKFEP